MLGVDDGLINGNFTFADIMFLVAAIVFVIQAVISWAGAPDRTKGVLIPIGLALLAVGWLVL